MAKQLDARHALLCESRLNNSGQAFLKRRLHVASICCIFAGFLLAGAAIGLAASFAVTRLLATLLYGVTPTDALTFFGSPLLLLLFAAIASGIPALRAARVDPAEALRNTP